MTRTRAICPALPAIGGGRTMAGNLRGILLLTLR